MRCATLVALLLLAASSLSHAQDRALISGDVEDRADAPLPKVQVTLSNDSLGITRTATTNADGYYFFPEVVPAEAYVVTVAAPGMAFSPARVRFDVEVGETRHVLPSFVGEKASGPVSLLLLKEMLDRVSSAAATRSSIEGATQLHD